MAAEVVLDELTPRDETLVSPMSEVRPGVVVVVVGLRLPPVRPRRALVSTVATVCPEAARRLVIQEEEVEKAPPLVFATAVPLPRDVRRDADTQVALAGRHIAKDTASVGVARVPHANVVRLPQVGDLPLGQDGPLRPDVAEGREEVLRAAATAAAIILAPVPVPLPARALVFLALETAATATPAPFPSRLPPAPQGVLGAVQVVRPTGVGGAAKRPPGRPMAILGRPGTDTATPPPREDEVKAEAEAPLHAATAAQGTRTGQTIPVFLVRDVVEVATLATAPGSRAASRPAAGAARPRLGLGRRPALPAETPVATTVALPSVVGTAVRPIP